MTTLRAAWNWARAHLDLTTEYPGNKLAFAKTDEALPFMTWEEAERRIAAGADPGRVWECLYLRPNEVVALLAWVKTRPVSPWVYPMFCFAAYTGARRSEIVRVRIEDLNLDDGMVTIREKKRDRRRNTFELLTPQES